MNGMGMLALLVSLRVFSAGYFLPSFAFEEM